MEPVRNFITMFSQSIGVEEPWYIDRAEFSQQDKAVIGIKKVVYSSPYPMKEAKEILKNNGISMIAFSGITYRGYFKLEGRKT